MEGAGQIGDNIGVDASRPANCDLMALEIHDDLVRFLLSVANRFNAVTVGVKHERGKIVGMIERPSTGLAVATPTGAKRGGVKVEHGLAVLRLKAQMHSSRG